MDTITDEYMHQMLTATKNYTLVILKDGPKENTENRQKLVWEHGRRNFALRNAGLLSIVCPVSDGSEVHGISIFNADETKTREIMDEDPGVKAGIFIYDIHPTRSFPGDSLPG